MLFLETSLLVRNKFVRQDVPSRLCNGAMLMLVHVLLHTFRCLLALAGVAVVMLLTIALSFLILSFFRCFHFSVGNCQVAGEETASGSNRYVAQTLPCPVETCA